jgi:hypothetical protein
MTDIVERINKLIKGWEMEYGITNKTMVAARDEILRLNDELHMARAQCLIRKDLIEKLKSGPGGIMEMKQTIADNETEIDGLRKLLDLVYEHDSNLLDHLRGWK